MAFVVSGIEFITDGPRCLYISDAQAIALDYEKHESTILDYLYVSLCNSRVNITRDAMKSKLGRPSIHCQSGRVAYPQHDPDFGCDFSFIWDYKTKRPSGFRSNK